MIAANGTQTKSIFKRVLLILLALLGIAFILWLDSWFMEHAGMPDLTGDVNFGLLMLIGFLTSFHCVGMCGPLILGYATKEAKEGRKSHVAHLLYGLGKTISDTAIGALFGAFGAIVAFTPYTQGAVGVAAGLFLILFGLHMLEIFPALSHFQFKTPTFVMRFVGKEYRKHSNPFVIGLLNGLMIICGPLQAMYVMAAGTGSWMQGAVTLFFFGVGTLPLLLGFGFLTSLLSGNLTPKLLKASGVIVMSLGLIMINRGLAVTGSGLDFNTLVARVSQYLAPTIADSANCENEQTIHMDVLKSRFSPNKFTLRKGIPVKWAINVKELNECNNQIVVREYGLEIKLHSGLQVIEFTPNEAGVVPWSCWMGMIPGTFIVVEDTPRAEQAPSDTQDTSIAETDQERWLRFFVTQWQQIADSFSVR
ncbi:MAG: sulfite exporter TauE/SafE family protein [Methylomonas sp.]|nr:sulfite exporter TauE/SafE family protein [Methylomonas sp.]